VGNGVHGLVSKETRAGARMTVRSSTPVRVWMSAVETVRRFLSLAVRSPLQRPSGTFYFSASKSAEESGLALLINSCRARSSGGRNAGRRHSGETLQLVHGRPARGTFRHAQAGIFLIRTTDTQRLSIRGLLPTYRPASGGDSGPITLGRRRPGHRTRAGLYRCLFQGHSDYPAHRPATSRRRLCRAAQASFPASSG